MPGEEYQADFCLVPGHVDCPIFAAAVGNGAPPAAADGGRESRKQRRRRSGQPVSFVRVLPWALIAILALAVVAVYARDLLRPAAPAPVAGAAAGAGAATDAAAVSALTTPSVPDATLTPTASPIPGGAAAAAGAVASAAGGVAATPVPGGRTVILAPKAGDAGWFASGEARGNHLGDSFLYAGYFDGKQFISGARIPLASVPRGAPILDAKLELTGLNAERFSADAGGTWSVQLLALDSLEDFTRTSFQELLNAPAAITLVPTLFAADLVVGRPNTLALDEAGRDWLAQQVLDGKEAIVARITGPGGGSPTLFAWDSGAGPATQGGAARLVLTLGALPPTVPPLPTERVFVATLTPTPANALTALAYAWEATAQALASGGATPLPYRIVTPTPPAENLATAQVYAAILGQPPLVVYTPVPGNEATAAANALYATAVAVTTGTFTPVPTHAVTPVVVEPTLEPRNAATVLAQVLAATAFVRENGTPTPRPANVLVATRTATPMTPTATPANQATAVIRAAEATLTAMARNAQTPVVPPQAAGPGPGATATAAAPPAAASPAARTPTPTAAPPPATPTPPVASPAATPPPGASPAARTPTPTVASPAATPPLGASPAARTPTPTASPAAGPGASGQAQNLILFRSDRDGAERIYALDPVAGQVTRVENDAGYQASQAQEARSPAGSLAFVRNDAAGVAQVFVQEGGTARQLTSTSGISYEPAWSPLADRLAFVSQESGSDEIYTITLAGQDLRRLTSSPATDKHPTWSPGGNQIVYWSNRDTGRRQLWIMNADGSNQRRLLVTAYNDWDPVWPK